MNGLYWLNDYLPSGGPTYSVATVFCSYVSILSMFSAPRRRLLIFTVTELFHGEEMFHDCGYFIKNSLAPTNFAPEPCTLSIPSRSVIQKPLSDSARRLPVGEAARRQSVGWMPVHGHKFLAMFCSTARWPVISKCGMETKLTLIWFRQKEISISQSQFRGVRIWDKFGPGTLYGSSLCLSILLKGFEKLNLI